MWGISFVTLYVSLVWLNFLYLNHWKPKPYNKPYPTVTIVVPAHNEALNIIHTLDSIVSVDYPKDKLNIIVVNDGSLDATEGLVRNFIGTHKQSKLILLNQRQQGKAVALNNALRRVDTELFACVDADSLIDRHSLKPMMPHFEDKSNAAVISALKVYKPRKIIEKMQHFEYMLGILARKIRSTINTLAMTPGVLSVYRTDILKAVGGFDKYNITEDFEIAMRLKSRAYNIQLETRSFTYTKVPTKWKDLKRQRVRWFRGYIYNHMKYRNMFFSKKDKFMGYFQLPLNIVSIFILLATLVLISYGSVTHLFELANRIMMIKGYLPSLFYVPPLKEIILGHDIQIMFPIYIGSLGGMYLFWIAHKELKEKIRYLTSIWAYFVVFPYLNFYYWMVSLFEESTNKTRKW